MRMYDIIAKKRDGYKLSDEEIKYFVENYTNDKIPDYQMSALLMAIYIKGMDKDETSNLTKYMSQSGDFVDLSEIEGIKVDKHSTGGVGDKTSIIIGPIVSACGVKVAKMSGRGLGHTGGTIDKLESISGFNTSLDKQSFFKIVKEIGFSIVSQTGNIAPADKKLYALRDVTATVESIPLIASSIMSKKLAIGSDAILLDVKTGSGAFMKALDKSIKLAKEMVSIGTLNKRKTVAIVTNMDSPLGKNIGNSLEMIEAIQTLQGNGSQDLVEICLQLSANMLYLAQKGNIDYCYKLAKNALQGGNAFKKLKAMVKAQGGDISVLDNVDKFNKAPIIYNVISNAEGYITKMQTDKFGIASMILGAGRESKADKIDLSAGIVLNKKVGDYIKKGDIIATLYSSKESAIQQAENIILNSITAENKKIDTIKYVYARITDEGVEIF